MKLKMKHKIVRTDTYNSLSGVINKALDNNHELRKVCQCKDCKWLRMVGSNCGMCVNENGENRSEFMNPYGSCEKCERR
jgi:hypothetical protein